MLYARGVEVRPILAQCAVGCMPMRVGTIKGQFICHATFLLSLHFQCEISFFTVRGTEVMVQMQWSLIGPT